ncbi:MULTISPECIES: flippase [unclassified Haloarcula]|uniref:flippase n=1 Tax=unclassified Haloarcula TaxID=2624677 RepID=UPI0017843A50|nr:MULTISPECIES: flippase [unclassified Haloarcula]
MSLGSKILSDSLYSTFRTIITMLRSVIVVPLITKLLGADSFGIWSTTFAFVVMMGNIGGLHLHGAMTRYGVSDTVKEQTYVDILSLSIITGAIISVAIGVIGVHLDIDSLVGNGYVDVDSLVAVSAVLVFLTILRRINLNFYRSKSNVKLYEIINTIKTLSEIAVLTTVFLFDGGIIHGMGALVAVSLILNVSLMSHIFKNYSVPWPNARNFPKYVRYGLPMVPASLSQSLHQNADKFLILFFLSPSAVGIYAVAYGVCGLFRNFTNVLTPSLYPRIAKSWDENNFGEITEVYKDIFRYYTIVAVPALVGIVFVSVPLLEALSTATVAEQGWILIPIMSVGMLLRGYENSLTYILTSAEKTANISKGVVLSTIVNIVLNLVLIPTYGIEGAAIGTLISQSLLTAIIYGYSVKNISIPLPTEIFVKSIVAAGFMALALTVVPEFANPYVVLVVYPAIGVCTYFVTIYKLEGISRRELSSIKTVVLDRPK